MVMKTLGSKRTFWVTITVFFSLVILLSLTAFKTETTVAQESTKQQLQGLSQAFRDIAKQVSPAVVYISTEQTVKGQQAPDQFREFFGDEFFRRFFGDTPQDREYKRRGLGSGFITNSDGYILTNNHVVAEADKIKVTLADKREFEATLVGTDPKSDVAVIKIEGNSLPVVRLGDSNAIEVGDWAVAIGTPFGLSQTVTAGIISAEGRSNIGINDYEDFIQTDAAINPGNSGGPLVNIDGEVIGINTAIYSRSGGYQGIGFAIPINMAKTIMDSLITKGKVVRGWLGVMIQPVTPEIAKGFDLKEATGTLVGDVLKGGPAEQAGLKHGDVIMKFDGQPIDGPNTLKNVVAATEVGKTVDMLIIRDGKELTVQVKIGEQPGDLEASTGSPSRAKEQFGLSVQELTPEIASQLGYTGDQGVIISSVEPGSPAEEAGLRRGDLIKEINRQPITSVEEYNAALAGIGKDESFLALVRRGENTLYVVVNAQ
ncbi:heat shock protease DegP/HtrA [Candidatus Vecturithrix granuli]|uniref:Probable periplasmic serine endoprotease DegP-like n=1 Tax=Vecturithrix granuli TaxID=1499967 RepID=A0A081CAT9_VECG1|nr:heat shock protease DegP/HtrA [Candidatus Vecturithrix granuli]